MSHNEEDIERRVGQIMRDVFPLRDNPGADVKLIRTAAARRRWPVLASVAAILAIAVGLAVGLSSTSRSGSNVQAGDGAQTTIPSTAVPPVSQRVMDLLAKSHFDLTPASSSAKTDITSGDAESIAKAQAPWSSQLLDGISLVTASNPTPTVSLATCWLVSFDTTGMHAGPIGQVDRSPIASIPPEQTYAVVLVDASDGSVLRVSDGYVPN
jgi:hypothetical protein